MRLYPSATSRYRYLPALFTATATAVYFGSRAMSHASSSSTSPPPPTVPPVSISPGFKVLGVDGKIWYQELKEEANDSHSSASSSASESDSYEESPYIDRPKAPIITSLDDVAERIKSGK
jgi:hypothetical protein